MCSVLFQATVSHFWISGDQSGTTHLIEIVQYEEWWKEKPPVTQFCTHGDIARMEEVQVGRHTRWHRDSFARVDLYSKRSIHSRFSIFQPRYLSQNYSSIPKKVVTHF